MTEDNTRRGKGCKYVCLGITIACTLAFMLLIVSTHDWVQEFNDDDVTIETSTESTLVRRLDADEKLWHNSINTKNELKNNIFYRLLAEYVETMDASKCYVCTQVPTSVVEGATYHSMPLTYGITCSIIMTLLYSREQIQYWYSDYDVIFSELKIIEDMNDTVQNLHVPSMRYFFRPKADYVLLHAQKNNLTCSLTKVEKTFLNQTEDRRRIMKEKIEQQKKNASGTNSITDLADIKGKLGLDAPHVGKFCVTRHKSNKDKLLLGKSECEHEYLMNEHLITLLYGKDPVFPGTYYICGQNAYYRLPKGWYGTCYLGIVFPKIYQLDELDQIPTKTELHGIRPKRETAAGVVGDIFGAMIPSVGVVLNSKKIRMLSTVVDSMLTNFTEAFLLLNTEIAAERDMTLQNRLALDILLAKSGGVCKMIGARHCCTYIPDNTVKVKGILTNLTRGISAELRGLKEDGIWEEVGKGFANMGHWLSNLWGGWLYKLVKGILIILICILGIWGMIKLIKYIREQKKRQRERKAQKEMTKIYQELAKDKIQMVKANVKRTERKREKGEEIEMVPMDGIF